LQLIDLRREFGLGDEIRSLVRIDLQVVELGQMPIGAAVTVRIADGRAILRASGSLVSLDHHLALTDPAWKESIHIARLLNWMTGIAMCHMLQDSVLAKPLR